MALLKIKTLFLALITLVTSTAATAAKNPFVKWSSLPQISQLNDLDFVVNKCFKVLLSNKKSGTKTKANDVLYGTRESYIDVYGKELYDDIMSAPLDRFKIGYYDGTVDNYGINLDGDAELVMTGLDMRNIRGLQFLNKLGIWIPIVKLDDEKVCFNGLNNPQPRQVASDPKPEAEKPGVYAGNPAGNNQQVSVNYYAKETSFAEGDAIRRSGADERELALVHGAMLAKDLMSTCNTCGTANTVVASSGLGVSNVTFAQSQVQPQNTVYYPQQPSGPQEVIVRNKANANDWVNTALMAANTLFNGTNTYRGIRLENNRRTQYSYYPQQPNYQYVHQQGPGFQGIYNDHPQVRYTIDPFGSPRQGGFTPVTQSVPMYMNSGYVSNTSNSGSYPSSTPGFSW